MHSHFHKISIVAAKWMMVNTIPYTQRKIHMMMVWMMMMIIVLQALNTQQQHTYTTYVYVPKSLKKYKRRETNFFTLLYSDHDVNCNYMQDAS
jgi:hypothetical protein